ncbi:hypothetical protein F5Y09DRAFT_158632 [Xylaria sp. FL1042]|nr:hypothetical protein F5Y09DRAFT_158632 [Xylaria sp. FL1042]
MGSESPPKRMTRARAAAASLGPKSAKSDRVTKSTKSAATTSAKKTAAAKKVVTAKKPAATAAKKKPAAATKKTTATKTAKTAANTVAKSATKGTTPATTTPTPTTSTNTNITTTTTTTTTGKRKLRTYDNDDNEDDLSKEDDDQHTMNQPAKRLRGRAKKAVVPEPDSDSELESESQPKPQQMAPQSATTTATNTRSTRGRPKKSTVTSASSSTVKTRTRKTSSKDDKAGNEDDVAAASEQPAKKTTRRRAATGTITTTYTTEPTPGLKSAVSRPASKASGVLKKTVTFEEPEKENMLPGAATKVKAETTGTTATGLRAKPVRKPTVSGRTTRASARAATTDMTEKKPLSPKKDGQNRPLSRGDNVSDDELGTSEKTPLKPLMKSPVKPPTGVRKLELPPPEKQKDENSPKSPEPIVATVLGSPARRPPSSPFKSTMMMMSPAKRVDSMSGLFASSIGANEQAAESPTKPAILQSPAKRPQMPLQVFQFNQESTRATRSPMKTSLLSTPAKRPVSPMKSLGSLVPQLEDKSQEASGAYTHTPMEEINDEELQSQIRADTGSISPEGSVGDEKTLESIHEVENEDSLRLESPTPRLNSTSPPLESPIPQFESPPSQLEFPGRLSAVLPRHADPAFKPNPLPISELATQAPQLDTSESQKSDKTTVESLELQTNEEAPADDGIKISEAITQKPDAEIPTQTTPPQPVPKRIGFGLRAKDLRDDTMSDSEDELAFSNKAITKYQDNTTASDTVPVTPLPPLFKGTERKITESAARAASRAIRSVSETNKFGYTPLSMQLGAWRASSPLKATQSQQKSDSQAEDVEYDEDEFSLLDENDFPTVETPAAKGFFDDEMKIRADMEVEAAMEAYLEADIAAKFDKHDFHDLGLMDEDEGDLSIIPEENETSLLNSPESEQFRSCDKSVSTASQEYGDENAVPIDPALVDNETDASTSNNVPVTPKRPFSSREFHTVSKVPLKRADDSPPRSFKRHCSTASKATCRRPSGPFSNVTLPSQRSKMIVEGQPDQEFQLPSTTPSKSLSWSSVGTPARTTRPDLDPALLRGAIVFVDVHTTEGADAGRIFVDLLVQMGARCVKSWPWNPTTTTDAKLDLSKVGITHVVFKDGGKRTLEKVNESDGIVHCVGVGWVLDCEKENRWVEEKDYRVDTTLIPRGGHNRRKSMEPKAVANMNGTLVTPMKATGFSREPQTVPNNYMGRRDSTIWMRSPSDHDEEEDAPSEPSEMDWESTNAPILTPMPQTPAPEMVAKFAMDITPGTPTASFDSSPSKNKLLMQTCPPKPSGLNGFDQGLVSNGQDQSVMMRLMAARRKSMQFAPKVASPLKKQWKQQD